MGWAARANPRARTGEPNRDGRIAGAAQKRAWSQGRVLVTHVAAERHGQPVTVQVITPLGEGAYVVDAKGRVRRKQRADMRAWEAA